MSKLYSVVRLKCPRCHKGNLFTKNNPYSFKDSMKMPDRCPVCNQDFQIEPGFYIGALWTSFPIVIFIMTLLSIFLLVFVKMELEWFFVAITVILLLLQPIIIRLGRVIWINILWIMMRKPQRMRRISEIISAFLRRIRKRHSD